MVEEWREGNMRAEDSILITDNCVGSICTVQLSSTLGKPCNRDAQCPTGVKCGSEVCGGPTATCSTSADCVTGREWNDGSKNQVEII